MKKVDRMIGLTRQNFTVGLRSITAAVYFIDGTARGLRPSIPRITLQMSLQQRNCVVLIHHSISSLTVCMIQNMSGKGKQSTTGFIEERVQNLQLKRGKQNGGRLARARSVGSVTPISPFNLLLSHETIS